MYIYIYIYIYTHMTCNTYIHNNAADCRLWVCAHLGTIWDRQPHFAQSAY